MFLLAEKIIQRADWVGSNVGIKRSKPFSVTQWRRFRLWNHVHGPAREGETAAQSWNHCATRNEEKRRAARATTTSTTSTTTTRASRGVFWCSSSCPQGKVDRFPKSSFWASFGQVEDKEPTVDHFDKWSDEHGDSNQLHFHH